MNLVSVAITGYSFSWLTTYLSSLGVLPTTLGFNTISCMMRAQL